MFTDIFDGTMPCLKFHIVLDDENNVYYYHPAHTVMAAYDNPYSNYYDQTPYDNPDSLYTSTGQVVSGEHQPAPGDSGYNPFDSWRPRSHHLSPYDDYAIPWLSPSATPNRYGDPYGGTTELGASSRRQAAAASPDRHSPLATSPGQPQPPPNPSRPEGSRRTPSGGDGASSPSLFPPSVGSRAGRYGDTKGENSDASDVPLFDHPRDRRRNEGSSPSMGGLEAGLSSGEGDEPNVR